MAYLFVILQYFLQQSLVCFINCTSPKEKAFYGICERRRLGWGGVGSGRVGWGREGRGGVGWGGVG